MTWPYRSFCLFKVWKQKKAKLRGQKLFKRLNYLVQCFKSIRVLWKRSDRQTENDINWTVPENIQCIKDDGRHSFPAITSIFFPFIPFSLLLLNLLLFWAIDRRFVSIECLVLAFLCSLASPLMSKASLSHSYICLGTMKSEQLPVFDRFRRAVVAWTTTAQNYVSADMLVNSVDARRSYIFYSSFRAPRARCIVGRHLFPFNLNQFIKEFPAACG